MLYDMECTEQSLAEMLASPLGQTCAQGIFDWINSGNRLTIFRKDGTVLVLSDAAAAHQALTELFDWTPLV
jgi:hypothetical protein